MRILTSDQMREVDRRAIEQLGIPSIVLMENAAIGVVDAIADRFPEAVSAAVFCGPGNNGGDGLAIARHLEGRGLLVAVFLASGRRPTGDAGIQLQILERSGIPVVEVVDDASARRALEAARGRDVVIDALFGTGLGRPLEGRFATLAEGLEDLGAPIVAVDLPSGLDASRESPIGPTVRADLTVTFAAPKIACVFDPAASLCGEVVVTDLGTPSGLVENAPGDLHLLTPDEVSSWWVPRRRRSHKGDFGHGLIIAGSPGKSGAVVLACRAAVAGGAGLVTAAVPAALLPVVDAGSLESMTVAFESESTVFDIDSVDGLLALAEDRTAVAVGPGLGTDPSTVAAVRRLVAAVEAPLVLDADALNAFAGELSLLADRPGATVLTPHPGEMGRLLGISTPEVQADRRTAVRRAAAESGAVVVLKGHRTLVALPDGEVRVNATGNPGMASGGSGDVLTGLALALLCQGLEPMTAACLAVWIHGAAGDRALVGPAVPAAALVDALPEAFRELARS